jgi:hypothetical protein
MLCIIGTYRMLGQMGQDVGGTAMAEERLVNFRASTIAARSPTMIEQLRTAAQSVIATRQALREAMPGEFVHCPALDLLFTLFVADYQTLPITALTDAGQTAPQVATRWITLFVQRDLVTLRGSDAMLKLVSR